MLPLVVPPSLAVVLTIARHILFLVPVIMHEVDRLTTGVVLPAVFAPVPLVALRHVQIDRLADLAHRRTLDHDRLRVDYSRFRQVADVDASIEAGLADGD